MSKVTNRHCAGTVQSQGEGYEIQHRLTEKKKKQKNHQFFYLFAQTSTVHTFIWFSQLGQTSGGCRKYIHVESAPLHYLQNDLTLGKRRCNAL